jgi:hypothetical protein
MPRLGARRSEGLARDCAILLHDWFPSTKGRFQNWVDPFTYRLTVRMPKAWRLAAATRMKYEGGQAVYVAECNVPVHSVPVCAGAFQQYEGRYGDVPISVCAFTIDEALARQLIEHSASILGILEKAFGPYPYGRLAIFENRYEQSSGMAYPNLISFAADRMTPEQQTFLLEHGLPHEIAHSWWRMGLPKWLAESGAVYGNFHFLEQTRGLRYAAEFMDRTLYEPLAKARPTMAPLVKEYGEHGVISIYGRGGYFMTMMQAAMGKSQLLATLRAFLDRNLPNSIHDEEAMNGDLEARLRNAAGEGLAAFVSDSMRSTKRYDPALVSVAQQKSDQGYEISLKLEHKAELQYPTPVRLTFDDGSRHVLTWNERRFQGEMKVQSTKPLKVAEIDPDHLLLDWNRGNNRAAPAAPWAIPSTGSAKPTIAGWKTYTKEDGLSGDGVKCLLAGRDGRMYAGFATGGFVNFKSWTLDYFDGAWHRMTPDEKAGLNIMCLAQSKDGTLWAGGEASFWRIQGDAAQGFGLSELRGVAVGTGPFAQRNHSWALAMLVDSHDNLWMGTENGISVFDSRRGTWRHYLPPDGLPGEAVTALAEDRDGVIWAGTDNGIASCRDGTWTAHPRWARHDLVLAIATDSSGTAWFGTYRNGLLAVRDGAMKDFTSANSPLPHDMVFALACDRNGGVWAGTADGLIHFDREQWKHFHRDNSGLPSNRIQRLAVDETGRLWIGTDVGVTSYEMK